jgi:hypothetical protein
MLYNDAAYLLVLPASHSQQKPQHIRLFLPETQNPNHGREKEAEEVREKSVQQPSLRQVLADISFVSSLPLRLALRRRDSGGPGDSRCVDLDARGS